MSASAPTVTETLKFTTKSIPKTTNIPMNVPKLSRKERRAEKNYVALCERSTHILPKTAFKRLVASTTNDIANGRPIRYSHEAVDALQTAVEQEMTTVFAGSALCASLAHRETITVADMTNFQTMRNM